MRSIRDNKGFTLIELMIVVVIIGILAAIAIPKFSNVSKSAKEAEAGPVLKQICTLRGTYFERFDAYPANVAAMTAVGWDATASWKYYSAFDVNAAGLATATTRSATVAASQQLNCAVPGSTVTPVAG